jgi:hypothetical protein
MIGCGHSGCAGVRVRTRNGAPVPRRESKKVGSIGSVITRSPTQQEPTMPSSPISLYPGGHGYAVGPRGETAGEVLVNRDRVSGLRPQKTCARNSPRISSHGLRIWIRRTPSALDRTSESARSGAACGTRSALSTVRENSISSRQVTDLRTARTTLLRASPKSPTVRNRPVQVRVGVTRRWGDPSTPHRCTHGRTTR